MSDLEHLSNEQEEAIRKKFEEDWKAHYSKDDDEFWMKFNPSEIMYLIGLLQLAYKHPNLPEGAKRQCVELVRRLSANVAKTPAMRDIIDLGWLRGGFIARN